MDRVYKTDHSWATRRFDDELRIAAAAAGVKDVTYELFGSIGSDPTSPPPTRVPDSIVVIFSLDPTTIYFGCPVMNWFAPDQGTGMIEDNLDSTEYAEIPEWERFADVLAQTFIKIDKEWDDKLKHAFFDDALLAGLHRWARRTDDSLEDWRSNAGSEALYATTGEWRARVRMAIRAVQLDREDPIRKAYEAVIARPWQQSEEELHALTKLLMQDFPREERRLRATMELVSGFSGTAADLEKIIDSQPDDISLL